MRFFTKRFLPIGELPLVRRKACACVCARVRALLGVCVCWLRMKIILTIVAFDNHSHLACVRSCVRAIAPGARVRERVRACQACVRPRPGTPTQALARRRAARAGIYTPAPPHFIKKPYFSPTI